MWIERADAYSTEESREAGEASRHDPKGIVWEPDLSCVTPRDIAEEAAYFLRREGVCFPSASHWHPGIWYTTDTEVHNWMTGEYRESSYFIKDAPPELELLIAQELVTSGCIRLLFPERKQ